VVNDYNALVTAAQTVNDSLPTNAQDAFFELVLWSVKACANLNELYVTAAKNALYASQGRASANDMAAKVATLFNHDASLTKSYNQVAGGKWNHMADQTHIGYTGWQEPSANTAPSTKQVTLASSASMGVAVEGSTSWWPNASATATLGNFTPYDKQPSRYIEVFNRGQGSFNFTTTSTASYLTIPLPVDPFPKTNGWRSVWIGRMRRLDPRRFPSQSPDRAAAR
jgi:hypothetical protein